MARRHTAAWPQQLAALSLPLLTLHPFFSLPLTTTRASGHKALLLPTSTQTNAAVYSHVWVFAPPLVLMELVHMDGRFYALHRELGVINLACSSKTLS